MFKKTFKKSLNPPAKLTLRRNDFFKFPGFFLSANMQIFWLFCKRHTFELELNFTSSSPKSTCYEISLVFNFYQFRCKISWGVCRWGGLTPSTPSSPPKAELWFSPAWRSSLGIQILAFYFLPQNDLR